MVVGDFRPWVGARGDLTMVIEPPRFGHGGPHGPVSSESAMPGRGGCHGVQDSRRGPHRTAGRSAGGHDHDAQHRPRHGRGRGGPIRRLRHRGAAPGCGPHRVWRRRSGTHPCGDRRPPLGGVGATPYRAHRCLRTRIGPRRGRDLRPWPLGIGCPRLTPWTRMRSSPSGGASVFRPPKRSTSTRRLARWVAAESTRPVGSSRRVPGHRAALGFAAGTADADRARSVCPVRCAPSARGTESFRFAASATNRSGPRCHHPPARGQPSAPAPAIA